ncbi:hypothetical protein HELRODRAFT_74739, partial [Helobdella robusta]|uniref:G-protein coupled receptors family 2 profile 1 domain-containing protein n=1 Tax=Helobdella robusta TaxID=6412 RepID=T1G1V1_HELRO
CPAVWDGVMCWPSAQPGTQVSQRCPDYIIAFRRGGVAVRRCLETGSWFISPMTNLSWTNYNDCSIELDKVDEHNVQVIKNALDIVSLEPIQLFLILLNSKLNKLTRKLHCPRNSIHINLFVSFILRATLSIIHETSHVGTIYYLRADQVWLCRLLTTMHTYFAISNNAWVFLEGLYLRNIIYRDVFTETHPITYYFLFGWGAFVKFFLILFILLFFLV